jgi:uncharacterized protein (TIGR03790 family)
VRRALALPLLLAGLAAGGGAPARPEAAAPEGAPASEAHPEVLIVVNQAAPISVAIGEAYRKARGVPAENVCAISIPPKASALDDRTHENTSPERFEQQVRAPVAACLEKGGLADRIEIIVTTKGVPLRIGGPVV